MMFWPWYWHSMTECTVRRLTIGQHIEKCDATTAQLSPAHFARAILKVSYTG